MKSTTAVAEIVALLSLLVCQAQARALSGKTRSLLQGTRQTQTATREYAGLQETYMRPAARCLASLACMTTLTANAAATRMYNTVRVAGRLPC